MPEYRSTEEIKEILTRHFWGDENIEVIAPIVSGLFNHCHLDKLAPIIMELLTDDPLVQQVTEIYERGSTLFFTLQETK
jgi:hypothetical protein